VRRGGGQEAMAVTVTITSGQVQQQ
jgi:hypothetical protein